ncbi:MAG: ATP-binding protein [Gammaproteobacteria bacterium]|nr:ATP-binding protein [Gammaproteobacteria bacterium]
MLPFRDYSIKTVIDVSFLFLLSYIAAMGVLDWYSSQELDLAIANTLEKSARAQQNVFDVRETVNATQRHALQAAVLRDENLLLLAAAEGNKFYELSDELFSLMDDRRAIMLTTGSDDEGSSRAEKNIRDILLLIRNDYRVYLKENLAIAARLSEGANVSDSDLHRLKLGQQEFNDKFDDLVSQIGLAYIQEAEQIKKSISAPLFFHFASFLSILLSTLILKRILDKKVFKPLSRVLAFLGGMDEQAFNRNSRMEENRKDEFGKLAFAINNMLDNIHNVTLSKILMERAKNRAEESEKAKSVFLSNMSHELRTPLNAILGLSEILEEDSGLSTDQRQGVKDIHRAGHYLLSLINDILDLSRIENGQLKIKLRSVCVDRVVQESIKLTQATAKKHGITVVNEIAERDVCVEADELRLKQVIVNLLNNAIRYNQVDGRVYIRLTTRTTGTVSIEVVDTGVGIDASFLEEIFKPFVQGKNVTDGEGVGIGLSITRSLVTLMQGEISVSSEPGRGSIFTVSLRRNGSGCATEEGVKPMNSESESPGKLAGRECKVLYVEDNAVNTLIVKKALSIFSGISFHSVMSPSQAAAWLENNSVDLLLLDLNLPEMSGYELHEMLIEKGLLSDKVPVIAVSANALPSDVEKSRQAGFYLHISKPLQIKEFRETIASVLALDSNR